MNKLFFTIFFLAISAERIISTVKNKEPVGKKYYVKLTSFLIINYTLCFIFSYIEFIIINITLNVISTVTGLFILITGIALRRYSIKTLGGNWSIHTKDIDSQRLIKIGPYKIIRHPYYAAVILELVGISLFFNAFYTLCYAAITQIPFLLLRISLEEKMLIAKFGEEYIQYKNKTSAFFPKKLIVKKDV